MQNLNKTFIEQNETILSNSKTVHLIKNVDSHESQVATEQKWVSRLKFIGKTPDDSYASKSNSKTNSIENKVSCWCLKSVEKNLKRKHIQLGENT